jgi:trans-aconitate methyltransferase
VWEEESLAFDEMRELLELVLDEVIALRPRTVLELGCSVGVFRRALEERLDVTYAGCDISPKAVELCGPGAVVCDLNSGGIPFHGPFDVVVGAAILEYIDDHAALLTAIRERSPAAVLTYFNMGHVSRRLARARGRQVGGRADWRSDVTPRQLKELLRDAGWRRVRTVPVHMWAPKLGRLPVWVPGRAILAKHLVFVATAD